MTIHSFQTPRLTWSFSLFKSNFHRNVVWIVVSFTEGNDWKAMILRGVDLLLTTTIHRFVFSFSDYLKKTIIQIRKRQLNWNKRNSFQSNGNTSNFVHSKPVTLLFQLRQLQLPYKTQEANCQVICNKNISDFPTHRTACQRKKKSD